MKHTRPGRRKGRKPNHAPAPLAAPITVTIPAEQSALGAQGDALVEVDGTLLYVPLALPGEQVIVRPGATRGDGRSAELVEVITPAADRVTPPCPHFGDCGGCALQHMAPQALASWKRSLIATTLAKRGFTDVAVDETVSLPAGTRRRAVFGWRRTIKGLLLGFNARQSDRLINLTECALLVPAITDILPRLRAALTDLVPTGGSGDILVTATDEGLDIRLELPGDPDLATREGLAALAEDLDLARLMLRIGRFDEPVAVRRPPAITFGTITVMMPPGAFLQPSAEGELAILDLIRQGLRDLPADDPAKGGPVADLFCGLGTFSLPLAADHHVLAADGDQKLTDSLAAAAMAPAVRGRIKTLSRDLFRSPLIDAELAGLAAVVFDPPRAGAFEQVRALATDGPRRIVAVSCNPATFARDARILVDGGYHLDRVTPVDQFTWSAHLELVAVFSRH